MEKEKTPSQLMTELQMPLGAVETLERYRDRGIPTGSCFEAILSNDLQESFARADIHTRAAMFHIVSWIYNYMPSAAHGSRERVAEWLKTRRESGPLEDRKDE